MSYASTGNPPQERAHTNEYNAIAAGIPTTAQVDWAALPEELWLLVFDKLSITDRARIGATCSALRGHSVQSIANAFGDEMPLKDIHQLFYNHGLTRTWQGLVSEAPKRPGQPGQFNMLCGNALNTQRSYAEVMSEPDSLQGLSYFGKEIQCIAVAPPSNLDAIKAMLVEKIPDAVARDKLVVIIGPNLKYRQDELTAICTEFYLLHTPDLLALGLPTRARKLLPHPASIAPVVADGVLKLHPNTPPATVVAVAGALNAGGLLQLDPNTPRDTVEAAARALNAGGYLYLHSSTQLTTVEAAARALNAGGFLYLDPNTPPATVEAAAGALNTGGILRLHTSTPPATVEMARRILGGRLIVR